MNRLLPELANRKVLRCVDGLLDDTASANRPVTVRDLLTMRMGFGFIMEPSAEQMLARGAAGPLADRRLLGRGREVARNGLGNGDEGGGYG